MIKDPIVNLLVSLFNNIGIHLNPDLLYITLYNLVPATIIGPILVYRGIIYNDWLIILVGLCLIVVDSMHFMNNLKKYQKTGTIG